MDYYFGSRCIRPWSLRGDLVAYEAKRCRLRTAAGGFKFAGMKGNRRRKHSVDATRFSRGADFVNKLMQ